MSLLEAQKDKIQEDLETKRREVARQNETLERKRKENSKLKENIRKITNEKTAVIQEKNSLCIALEKEKIDKNKACAEIAKKEMEKLDMRTELKKKTEALAAKEQDITKDRSEIAEMKTSQGKQNDLISNLNIINDDAVKKLNEYKEEMEQKDTDLIRKNSQVKALEEEVEEYKVIVARV